MKAMSYLIASLLVVATPSVTSAVSETTSPTPTPSASPTVSPAVSASPSANPSASPSVSPSPAVSPAASPTVSPSPLPALTITNSDLSTVRSTFWSNVGLFFYFKKSTNYYKIRLRMANSYLLAAQTAAQAGDTTKAQMLLTKYQTELSSVQTFVAGSAANSQLADQLLTDSTVHLASLDSIKQTRAALQLNRELEIQRLKVLRQMSSLLGSNRSADQIDKKLQALSDHLAQKDAAAKAKYERKMSLINDLSSVSGDASSADLQAALRRQEITDLNEAATQLDTNELEELAGKGKDSAKRVEVLTRVLEKAPETAKPALQAALERARRQAALPSPSPVPSADQPKALREQLEKKRLKVTPSPKNEKSSVKTIEKKSGDKATGSTSSVKVRSELKGGGTSSVKVNSETNSSSTTTVSRESTSSVSATSSSASPSDDNNY